MVREAESRGVMDVIFLVMLVLQLEREANEAIRAGSLRLTALRWELRARTAEGTPDRRGWTSWRASVIDLATDLARAEAVRVTLAARYLDGREVLSPNAAVAWRELHHGAAALVEAMAGVPGQRQGRRPDIDALGAGAHRSATVEASMLVEHERARTLDLLGDHAGAALILERGLRRAAEPR